MPSINNYGLRTWVWAILGLPTPARATSIGLVGGPSIDRGLNSSIGTRLFNPAPAGSFQFRDHNFGIGNLAASTPGPA